MNMNKYSEIEIETAKRLHDAGYKWIARCKDGEVDAFSQNPYKLKAYGTWASEGKIVVCVSGEFTPIFQGIKWGDDEPTYIKDIINPQILDDAERRYLSAVIRPFRDNVKSISKCISYPSREFIAIYCKNGDKTLFPWFEAGTMYQGMERYKKYTLEELGL